MFASHSPLPWALLSRFSRKNGLPTKGLPFSEPFSKTFSMNAVFLREERLSNAHGKGLCEANAGHAPRGMVY